MLSSNQFYIFGYFNSLPPCLNFWLSFLLLKCMAAIIFSIGNNTCNLLSDHHFKSYLETINHRERERKRETERQRQTERQRGRERDSERQREKSFQTVLTNYYRINDSKQYLQTIIRESFQTILTNYCQRIQTILTNYYQRTNCKLHLEDIREFNSFQRILLIYSTFIISNSSQTMLLALA